MQNSQLVNRYNKVIFRKNVKRDFISIIIPVYRDVDGLKDTLNSLITQSLNKNLFEIIVANDGADPKISKLCKDSSVKEVLIKPNKGSYNARNAALTISSGEFIGFTDADVKVSKDWIESALKVLKNYDYVGGPVDFFKKDNLSTYQKYAKLYEFNSKNLFKNSHYCVTANMFTKRNVIKKIGGFDNRLLSGGDGEFGTRVLKAGFEQTFSDSIKVEHPFRDLKGFIKKKRRINKGFNDLVKLYPERYSFFIESSHFDAFTYSLKPPIEHITDLKLFFFTWWQKLIDFYFRLTYIENIPLFHRDSRLYKIFGN